jgi:hypothetical protein
MGSEELVRWVMSVISAGVVGVVAVAILNWVKEARSATRQREVAYLQDQLRLLYGPLHCLTAQNIATIKRAENLQQALNPMTNAGPHEQELSPVKGARADRIIDLSNAYSEKVKENNTRITQILEANWNLIDLEDVDPFVAFLADCERMQVEVVEKHAEGVLPLVCERLGAIHYARPEFVEQVTEQWNTKRKRRDKLLMPRGWSWWRRRRSRKAG